MLYIVKNALPPLPAKDKGLYPVDGAPSHMHASVPLAMKKQRYQEYISPPGVTPWAQACDKTEINKNFGQDMEHRYTDWVGEELERDPDDRKPVPAPPRDLFAQWVRDAWEHIPDEDLRKAMLRAIFPGGLKLSQLEDVAFFAEQHPMNEFFFRGTGLPTAVRKNQPLVPRSNLGGKVCARTNPWFRGQTLLVLGHGGGGGVHVPKVGPFQDSQFSDEALFIPHNVLDCQA